MEGHKPPYIQKVKSFGEVDVWIVDGSYIRKFMDEEFTNYAQHYHHDYIPENELWIDQEAAHDELHFFMVHLLTEWKLMKHGVPFEEAIDRADKAERRERIRAGDLKKATNAGKEYPKGEMVHKKLMKVLESGVKIWIVDGRLVRSVFDIDFTEGGHEFVYEYVPEGEVWLDDDLEDYERPYVLLHELHERNLMQKGWTYNKAHESSSKIEYYCRFHPSELHEHLAEEGWV